MKTGSYNRREMGDLTGRFSLAMQRIDAANSEVPAEVIYSQRMTEWLGKLYPRASEVLQLAARAQHIRRWEVPRDRYPMDRAGYYKWRTGLYTFHGDVTAEILREVGYDGQAIGRVRSLLKKEKLKADPEMQALEDVICVVFLENYFADFAAKHDEDKLIGILRRTWAKMSQVGQDAALKLPMSAEAGALIRKALTM